MQQLISIETVPISIEYVEKSPTRVSNKQSARLQIERENHTMSIKSSPISIKMDTYESSDSFQGYNLTYTATAQYSKDGNLRLNVQMDNGGTNAFAFKQFGRGIDNIMDFLPKSSANSSSELQGMQINFDMSHLASGFPPVNNLDTSFLPPDLELKVVERPKVIIKYVGGPIYIPKSADPNYDPPENVNQIFDGKSNFDVKA